MEHLQNEKKKKLMVGGARRLSSLEGENWISEPNSAAFLKDMNEPRELKGVSFPVFAGGRKREYLDVLSIGFCWITSSRVIGSTTNLLIVPTTKDYLQGDFLPNN